MSQTVEKPNSAEQVGRLIKPVGDHSRRPWHEKGIVASLPQQMTDTRGGFGIFPYLNTRLRLWWLFNSAQREQATRATGYESHSYNHIRENTEVKIVKLCRGFDPNAFIAAGVGDLKVAHHWLKGLKEDHPLIRNVLLALRQNAVALPPILAALATPYLLKGVASLQEVGVAAAGSLALNTAASLTLTQGESLRRPVTPDPVHFRLAAAVALTQDIERYNRSQGNTIEKTNALKAKSAVCNLVEGTLMVSTHINTQAVADDDEMLYAADRESTKRQRFINRERAFIFQEVLEDPKIGLKLLAAYMYDNQIYLQKVLPKLNRKIQEELKAITTKITAANSDPEVSGDPNTQMVIQALEEIELPEMMQLLLNVVQSEPNGMNVLFWDKGNHRNIAELRTHMMKSLTVKMNIPLIGAVLALRNECPPEEVRAKLTGDLVRVIPPVHSKEVAGGRVLPERLKSDEAEYVKAANTAAWNALRVFFALMKAGGMTPDQREAVFTYIREKAWPKRKAYKEGIPLPVQLMKLLELMMDDSEAAMNFVYDEYARMMQKSCEPQATPELTSTEQILKNERHVIKSLNKRGKRFSDTIDLKDKEIARLNLLADDMGGYCVHLLDLDEASLQRLMTASEHNTEEVQWYAKVKALKDVSMAIISNRMANLQDPGYKIVASKFIQLEEKIDKKISKAIQQKLERALPVITQQVNP